MMSAGMGRKVSIHDYPEHLNPFREDDHKPKFWTLGKRLSRSNSIQFSGIKDIKNSWAFRSFMKKGKKREQPPLPPSPPQAQRDPPKPVNGDQSPIVFRRAMMYSSMSRGRGGGPYNSVGGALEQSDRYEYRGSVTPLPRSRFQERLRSTSQHEVSSLCATPCMSRSETYGSRASIESANPFEPDPTPPKAPARRKKKRAPLPPADSDVTMKVIAEPTVTEITEVDEEKNENNPTYSVKEEVNLNVEVKIVEEEDLKSAASENANNEDNGNEEGVQITEILDETESDDHKKVDDANAIKDSENNNVLVTKSDSEEDILKSDVLKSVSFSKVDIIKYRRNSSVDEDDIKLRRGNLEDFALATKRSKSFSNGYDPIYATYDISLNDDIGKDTNGNEEPQKLICKIYDASSHKKSVETISSTDKELMDIDQVRREFEREINKLNAALEADFSTGAELSVSDIKKKYDKDKTSPNPIPKPRRSPQLSNSSLSVNGKLH